MRAARWCAALAALAITLSGGIATAEPQAPAGEAGVTALPSSSCRMQYLYQGMAPGSGGDYNRLPWRLGLLTQTNSNC